jgi:hypothetical protein
VSAPVILTQITPQKERVVSDRAEVFRSDDVIVQVLCYGANDRTGQADVPLLRPDQAIIGFLRPLGSTASPRDWSE